MYNISSIKRVTIGIFYKRNFWKFHVVVMQTKADKCIKKLSVLHVQRASYLNGVLNRVLNRIPSHFQFT